MQIPDLNNELFNPLAGRTNGKGGNNIKLAEESFSGLLQSVGTGGEKEGGAEKTAADSWRRQVSSVNVKEKTQAEKQVAAPKKRTDVPTEKESSPAKAEKENNKNKENDKNTGTTDCKNVSEVSENKDEKTPAAADGKIQLSSTPVAEDAPVITENETTNEVAEGIVLPVAVPPEVLSEVVAAVDDASLSGEFVADGIEGLSTGLSAEPEGYSQPEDVSVKEISEVKNAGDMIQTTASQTETVVSEISLPEDEKAEETMIRRQEEKIAELLPEETAVEIKVSVKDDKITGFEPEKAVTPLIDDVNTEENILETDADVSVVSENAQVKVEAPDFGKITAAGIETRPADLNAAVISSGDKGEIYAVQALTSGEMPRSSETAGLKLSSGNNAGDVRNDGLTREVAEQIKVNITRSAVKGADKIEIQLKPADLGRLEIKMQIAKDGTLHAHIVASSAETLEILQKDLSSLKEAFNNAGYQTEDGSFSFGYHGEEQNNNERERLRTFIGEVISHDVAEELAANDYIGTDGVNIRV